MYSKLYCFPNDFLMSLLQIAMYALHTVSYSVSQKVATLSSQALVSHVQI